MAIQALTKNFGFLKKYLIENEDFSQYIETSTLKIEKLFREKEFKQMSREAGELTEALLQFLNEVEEGELNSLITNITRRLQIPTEIIDALHQIRKYRNKSSHSTYRREKTFDIEMDESDALQMIKALFRILKFTTLISNERLLEEDELNVIRRWRFDKTFYIDVFQSEELSKFESIDDSTTVKLKSLIDIVYSVDQFVIPTYQRKYTWSIESIEVLLGDIQARIIDNKQHYMGALAIAQNNNDDNKKRIIDGQQRITTTLLLIKAMVDIFTQKQWQLPQELEDISNTLKNKYANKASINKDQEFVNRILSLDPIISNTEAGPEFRESAAYKNYVYLMQYFRNMDNDVLLTFFTTFAMNFVAAELLFKRAIDDEIDIFENLNSKGTELSSWDLIKNYFFTRFESNMLIEHEVEIESMIKNYIVAPTSAKFKKNWELKMHHFFNIYNRIAFIVQKEKICDNKAVPHKAFKDVWPKTNKKFENLLEFDNNLSIVRKYLKIFNEIESGSYSSDSTSPLAPFRLHLKNLDSKDIHYPLVMQILFDNSIWDGNNLKKIEKQKQILNVLKVLDHYITRLLVVKGTGQSLGTLFDKLLLKFGGNIDTMAENVWKELVDMNSDSRMPSLEAFIDTLNNPIKNLQSMSILRTIEAYFYECSEKSGQLKILQSPSLEHIFPQKPDGTWHRDGMEEHEFKKILKSSYIDKIGNHLILGIKLNASASNGSFYSKKLKYRDDDSKLIVGINNPGINLMNLLLKNDFRLEDINTRTEQIKEICKVIYKDLF